MRPLVAFFLALGLGVSIASLGFHLNDEAALGAAAYNLLERGSLYVDEVPAAYAHVEGGSWDVRVSVVDGHGYIAETHAGAVLAHPAYLMLRAWTSVAPLGAAFVVLQALALGGGLLAWRRDAWRAHAPRRVRVEMTLAGALVALALAQLPLARDAGPEWVPVAAYQLTSLLLFATASAALAGFVRAWTGRANAARLAVVVFLFGTTAAFWSFSLKYHVGLHAAFALVLWLRFAPGRTLAHHAAAAAIAGLAFWLHARAGGILLVTLGLIETVVLVRSLARERRPGWRRAAILLAAVLVGAAPYLAENALLYGNPLLPGSVVGAPLEPDPTTGAREFVAPSADEFFLDTILGRTALAELPDLPRLLWATWVHPPQLTPDVHVQFGLLELAPLLVLAPLGAIAMRGRNGGAGALVGLFTLLFLLVYGAYAARPGAGSFDSRYLGILHVPLAAYAAAFLDRRTACAAGPVAVAAVAAVATLTLLAILLFGRVTRDYTAQFHMLRDASLAALVIVVAWGAIRVARPGWDGARHGYADAPLLALGLLPSVLFALQFLVHHPPRSVPGTDGAAFAHVIPATQALSALLDSLWGT